MSWQSWCVGNDLRQQIQESDRKGHSAGKKFVRQNRRKDKIWFSGALQEIEGQMKDMHLPEAVQEVWKDADKTFGPDNPLSKGVENLQHIADPSSWITDYLKGNLPEACVRASISCAVFHEVKRRGIKRGARRLQERHPTLERLPAATDYVCDIMLPTPLYGPFFLFLVGKAREWVVGATLSAVGLKED